MLHHAQLLVEGQARQQVLNALGHAQRGVLKREGLPLRPPGGHGKEQQEGKENPRAAERETGGAVRVDYVSGHFVFDCVDV